MNSRRVVRLVTRWTTRNTAHNVVKNLYLAGTIYSNVWCNQIRPLMLSRFSSSFPSNGGDDISGDAPVNTSRDVTPEVDVKVEAQSFSPYGQKSTSGVQVHAHSTPLPPIPSLPPAVVGYPTPWLDKQDHVEYLVPLYPRGWGVSFKKPKAKELQQNTINREGSESLAQTRPTARLVGRFKFKNYKLAVAFLSAVAEIAESENHHPHILTVEHGRTPSVALVTQTDSAIRPAWSQGQTRRLGGITRRDLRLAVLVETLYTDKYEEGENMRSVRPVDHQPNWDRLIRRLQGSSLDRPALEELNRRQPFRVVCHACGGPHTLVTCPVRHKYPPPKPCNFCGEKHWTRDCPKALRGQYQCTICGMNHPTEVCPQNKPLAPCPSCGGDHWLADCRAPQLSEGAAQQMMLSLPNDK